VRTDDLILELARDANPVRRLPPPGRRAALWLALALPYAAFVIALSGSAPGLGQMAQNTRFLVEQAATLATAVTAAVAAFSLLVPGRSRRLAWLPLFPLAVWLLTLGQGCLADWRRLGPEGLSLRIDWDCFVPMFWIGLLPTVAMVVMLRRGAPLAPRQTMTLGALAIAALTNFALQLFHVGDVSIMVLVWHFGSAVLFSALVGWLGAGLLSWRRLQPAIASYGGDRPTA
jgi:hypothetical protein